DDHVDTEVAPRQLSRVADGEHLQKIASDVDAVVDYPDLVGQPAHHRVELEEMGHGLDRTEVVHGDEVDVGPRGLRGPEEAAADAPEAVDPHAYRHAVHAPCRARGTTLLVDIPMHDHGLVPVLTQPAGDLFGHHHRTMLTAGAAERERQVALPFTHIGGKEQ